MVSGGSFSLFTVSFHLLYFPLAQRSERYPTRKCILAILNDDLGLPLSVRPTIVVAICVRGPQQVHSIHIIPGLSYIVISCKRQAAVPIQVQFLPPH